MTDHDVTLIDLTYFLIVVEVAMIWCTGQANLFGRSTSQISMDIGNDNDDSLEMISSPKGEKLANVKKCDPKRKANYEI